MSVTSTSIVAQAPAMDLPTQRPTEDLYLAALPEGFMPFDAFAQEFSLGNTSTEQASPITKHLSQVMHTSIPQGMDLLLEVDENVIKGLESFIRFITLFTPILAEKLSQGGRIFLVGSGSSGRVAIDSAAKCTTAFPHFKEYIHGVIAGGDSAFIRAKEGFEDSEADRKDSLKGFHLTSKDTVILISASGSASFNVGCGHYAANADACVLYFYNSNSIPVRTQQLFDRTVNPAIPLCVDIGPQAISGSTRLQGATLAEGCLGALLASALYLTQGKRELAKQYPVELLSNMQRSRDLIKTHLHSIQRFPELEYKVFSSSYSNFRQLSDRSDQGYVTFFTGESIREVLIDSTETSTTFSTNPIRREGEVNKKRAEFRAYMIGQDDNRKAWAALLGREVRPDDIKDIENFLLASEAEGVNTFAKRPLAEGNFLIGVLKVNESESIPDELIRVLKNTKIRGGLVGLIAVCKGKLPEVQATELNDAYDATLIIENAPSDALGFSETILLKQILNLISNSSMVLMNKVHGNQMVDVRASNKKLIDRCVRLIKAIWSESHPNHPHEDKLLYHYVAHVSAIKRSYQEQGHYTPSVIKIVLTMLALQKTPEHFQEVIDYLFEKQERIDWIGEDQ